MLRDLNWRAAFVRRAVTLSVVRVRVRAPRGVVRGQAKACLVAAVDR